MLSEYEKKRDFTQTIEPPPAPGQGRGPLLFVVQKHAARRLHYDLRLELDGILKSWAVPAGPSLDPARKRLAVMVEDHPAGYASFEGVIPKGQYGAGPVMVWDAGDYSPEEKERERGRLFFGDRQQAERMAREGLAAGKLSFVLRGQKLKGSWTLVKTARGNDWLLIKHRDYYALPARDILQEQASALSGLTLEELRAGARPPEPDELRLEALPGARPAPFPSTMLPMLASIARAPFSDPAWLFEPKLDGYRIIALIQEGEVRLLSRGGLDVTGKYGEVVSGLALQPASRLVLDGEMVALDAAGKPCFQCLQGFLKSRGGTEVREASAVVYFVFDLLHVDGYDLCRSPLRLRKRVLERVLRASGEVQRLEHYEKDGEAVFEGAISQGLEGIVAKRRDSPYQPGVRSPDWLKMKSVQSDDFVIGGYTRGAGARAHTFGALLLGYYDEGGRLMPAGHAGSGFDEPALVALKELLDSLRTGSSPFAVDPAANAPVTWVRPELVAEVKFSEWTQDGKLRAPVFLRLRDDKASTEVRRPADIESHAQAAPGAGPMAAVLEQLQGERQELTLLVEGERLELSNLDKVLWPEFEGRRALTKRDLLVYLAKVSPHLLRHMRDRPLTLNRFPGGVHGEHFYQKHWGHPLPGFVEWARLSEQEQKDQQYMLCNNLPTLLWLGQIADLELHTWLARVTPGAGGEATAAGDRHAVADAMTHYPDFMIFDVDPYIYAGTEAPGEEPQLSRQGFARGCEASLWLKESLDSLALPAFIKTSGRTGLHIFVPLLRQLDFEAVRGLSKTVCTHVLQRHPGSVTMDWAVEKRTGKVFLDYNQNVRGKTLASVYSPRPSPEATVSAPLRWDELGKVYPTDFTLLTMPGRLEAVGDLWAGMTDARAGLRKMLGLE